MSKLDSEMLLFDENGIQGSYGYPIPMTKMMVTVPLESFFIISAKLHNDSFLVGSNVEELVYRSVSFPAQCSRKIEETISGTLGELRERVIGSGIYIFILLYCYALILCMDLCVGI
ncbi:hypothetical protein L1049_000687 [Liquidambar formosana]|uniref:Uncharacterized protein n=1 Tax=Liquidambar formosana TaxID=63359 RepID=A0AAP0N984_LIQFO